MTSDDGGICGECHGAGTFFYLPIPDYFTDPEAMVGVMTKLASLGFRPLVNHPADQWHACVEHPERSFNAVCNEDRSYSFAPTLIHTFGSTPMEAVAEAAYQWAVTTTAG